MIVNYTEEGWEVITQRSHGILAAQIGAQWRESQQPGRWMETLLAIAEHDDAENELDGENLLTPAGGPLNFDMKNFDLKLCTKLHELTITKSRYVALLASMHMVFLYRKDEAENPEAKRFLDEQRKLQAGWQKELRITRDEVDKCYALLEWCDALSLLLCRKAVQPENRQVEISTGPDGRLYHLVQLTENSLAVAPWPFEKNLFDVGYEYRIIKQIHFNSSAEFRNVFLTSAVKEKVWRFEKGEKPSARKSKKKV